MIDPKDVSAVLVTKGGTDIWPIQERIKGFGQMRDWNNSFEQEDQKVYGRYLAATRFCGCDYIYVQDDDCLVDAERLCAEYQPGELLCNVQASHARFYADIRMSLVGWGAILPRSMIDFSRYLEKWPLDDLFLRECDRVFTRLNYDKLRVVDIGVEHLPHAYGQDRMGTEARHGRDLEEIKRRLAAL